MTAATIPEYMRRFRYKSPINVRNSPLQYAKQTQLASFDFIASKPDTLEDFNNTMTGVRLARSSWFSWFPVHEDLLKDYDQDTTLMVDIGGGWGHDLVAFRTTWAPDAALELQDLPHVIADAVNLPLNIKCREYDFLANQQPVKGARLYFFHFIFHDWPDDECLQILSNTACAMTPEYSKILINDFILPDRGCPTFPALMDINMLTIHQGLERSESQWRDLVKRSRLHISKMWAPNSSEEGIIELVKANIEDSSI
ncbi:MAG: hypothetical protein Q9226_005551 [Calogaya cf. arnoldii]